MSPFLGATSAALVGGIILATGASIANVIAGALIAYAVQRILMSIVAISR